MSRQRIPYRLLRDEAFAPIQSLARLTMQRLGMSQLDAADELEVEQGNVSEALNSIRRPGTLIRLVNLLATRLQEGK